MINGSSGNDRIVGQSGKDEIDGGSGNDNIDGGESDDTIVGGPGTDHIAGGNDDDTINVRDGERDVVSCGTGNEDGVTADPVDSVAGDCESGEQPGSDGDGRRCGAATTAAPVVATAAQAVAAPGAAAKGPGAAAAEASRPTTGAAPAKIREKTTAGSRTTRRAGQRQGR